MDTPLGNKRIVLGITGSIAAYKSADLASKLAQAGAEVDVILTQSAINFVNPLTFQSVTGRSAYTENDLWGSQGHILHIGLSRNANLLVIAPITANTMAKLAYGIADNLLTVTALAARCPVLLAPAMDGGMYAHPATQENIKTLLEREVIILGPAEGHLASGITGVGRMVEPDELFGQIRFMATRQGPLKKQKIVVSAGGTQEPIDLVRFIANRSTGRQGYALAQAALDRGANVVLITAASELPPPTGAEVINVRTAEEMKRAVLDALPGCAALIMAAAVSDFRPSTSSDRKLKKEMGIPDLTLEATPDILSAVAEARTAQGFPKVTVGFAAESEDLINHAQKKLESKKLDLIVANDITAVDAGFAVETNRVTILDAGGGQQTLPLMTKDEVAQSVLERVTGLLDLQ